MKNTRLILIPLMLVTTTSLHSQWVPTNGPLGGWVGSLAVSGTNILLGGDSFVWVSSNNGTSWNRSSVGLPPNFSGTALASSGQYVIAGSYDGNVFLSTDGGLSWVAANSGLGNAAVSCLLFNGTKVFAGTQGSGIYRSTNYGANWSSVGSGLPPNVSINSLVVTGTNIFAAIGPPGIYRSTDDGTSWSPVNSGLPPRTSGSSLAVCGGYLFAGTYGSGIFRSTNNGTSWTAVNSGFTSPNAGRFAVSGTNIFVGAYGEGSEGVFLSTNYGTTWTNVSLGPTFTRITDLVVNGTTIFAGTYGGGAFRSTNNGASWTAVNTGLMNTSISDFATTGKSLFAGAWEGEGVYRSTDEGVTWVPANKGIPESFDAVCLLVSGLNVFVGGYGGLFRSTNDGVSWTAVNTGLANTNVNALAMLGTNLFAGTDGGVFRSSNDGVDWAAVNTGLLNITVSSLGVMGTNLFAGTNGGGIFRSTNSGTSWTAVNSGLTNLSVRSLEVSGIRLFAGTAGGVFRSSNSGTSWTAVNSGLPSTFAWPLAASGTNLFVSIGNSPWNPNEIYVSTDDGASWSPKSDGLSGGKILCLKTYGTNLFAGTFGNGVWRRPLTEMITPPISIQLYGPFFSGEDETRWWPLFYSRSPIPQNSLAVGVRLVNNSSDTLNNIEFQMTANGVPLSLRLNNIEDASLDLNNDGKVDRIPCKRYPVARDVSFFGVTPTYVSNQYDLRLESSIRSIDGKQTNIVRVDTVSLLFSQYQGSTYNMTRDAYKFENLSSLSLNELIRYGPSGIPYMVLFEMLGAFSGRCYGMAYTSGLYFLYPSMKPVPGDPHSWDSTNALVTEMITLAHLSQAWKAKKYDNKKAFETIRSNLINNRPTLLGINGRDGNRTKHAVLATKITEFKSGRAYVYVYENEAPGKDYEVEVSYASSFDFLHQGFAYDVFAHEIGSSILGKFHGTMLDPSGIFREIYDRLDTTGMKVFAFSGSTNACVKNALNQRFGFTQSGSFVQEFSGGICRRIPTNNAPGDSLTLLYVPKTSTYQVTSYGSTNALAAFEAYTVTSEKQLATTVAESLTTTSKSVMSFNEGDPNRLINIDLNGDGKIDQTVPTKVSIVSAVEIPPSADRLLPSDFLLHQNYPNPFNPTTTISFELPKSSRVSLKVFNTLGQVVAILVDGQKQGGFHQIQWDASNVPSGIYFYLLQAEEYVETKKMVLVR